MLHFWIVYFIFFNAQQLNGCYLNVFVCCFSTFANLQIAFQTPQTQHPHNTIPILYITIAPNTSKAHNPKHITQLSVPYKHKTHTFQIDPLFITATYFVFLLFSFFLSSQTPPKSPPPGKQSIQIADGDKLRQIHRIQLFWVYISKIIKKKLQPTSSEYKRARRLTSTTTINSTLLQQYQHKINCTFLALAHTHTHTHPSSKWVDTHMM